MPPRPFRVGRSKTGLGLFATRFIKKRTRIVEYKGRKIPNEVAERLEAKGARYMYELNKHFTLDGTGAAMRLGHGGDHDEFFALGDNRDESRDSRSFGPVPRVLVKGRALFVYWSVRPPAEAFAGRSAGLRRLLDGAIHFFARTRWERTFRVVR